MADREAHDLKPGDFVRIPDNPLVTSWFRGSVARVSAVQGRRVYLDVYYEGRLLTSKVYGRTTLPALIPLAPDEGAAMWLIDELSR